MKALTYRNTKTTLPNWTPIHDSQPRGIAYDTGSYFVHIYGRDTGVWVLSPGLTVTVRKTGDLRNWVESAFGAVDIEECVNEVGHTIEGVWRPGLVYEAELLQGLNNTEVERRLAEQALRILVQRLDEILIYIEPTVEGLATFGHRTRELLILACTEVENGWTHFMRRASATPANGRIYTTQDYVKLNQPLFLQEYEICLPLYADIPPMRPFHAWDRVSPTQSLPWYDAYNKTKHDRNTHFSAASVRNCVWAVAAALVLFCSRFGPFPLLHGLNPLTTLSNQMFSINLSV